MRITMPGLGLALAGALLAAPAGAQQLPRAELRFPDGERTVELPFEHANGFVVIPVTFESVGTLRFVLDSGAPVMVVPDTVLAARMNLRIVAQARVGGAGDGDAQMAPLASGVSARVGPLEVSNGLLLVGVAGDALAGVDGVIGLSLFQNAVVEIDWEERVVRFHDPAHFTYDGPGEVLPLRLAPSRHPYLEASIAVAGGEARPVRLVLDSGARQAMTLYPAAADSLGRPVMSTRDTVVARGSRGESRGDMGPVRLLRLGGHAVEDVVAAFPYAGGNGAMDGVIGLPLLERFHVIVDLPGERVIFERRAGPDAAASAMAAVEVRQSLAPARAHGQRWRDER